MKFWQTRAGCVQFFAIAAHAKDRPSAVSATAFTVWSNSMASIMDHKFRENIGLSELAPISCEQAPCVTPTSTLYLIALVGMRPPVLPQQAVKRRVASLTDWFKLRLKSASHLTQSIATRH